MSGSSAEVSPGDGGRSGALGGGHVLHPRLRIADHPLIRHKLTLLRDEATPTKLFKELVAELTTLLTYEATRELHTEPVEVRTPVATHTGERILGKKLVVVPILRAGLGMVEGVHRLLPGARVGHLGMYRNEETLKPVEYYSSLPSHMESRTVLVVDPMLATGGSAEAALTRLRREGARDLRLVCIVAAPEGVRRLAGSHPDVPIFAAALDRELNAQGFIVPGLGDAGDRLFGTR